VSLTFKRQKGCVARVSNLAETPLNAFSTNMKSKNHPEGFRSSVVLSLQQIAKDGIAAVVTIPSFFSFVLK